MSEEKISLSAGKTITHIAAYLLLFLAGDLVSSLLFDLLFSVVKLPSGWMYQLPRALGTLAVTWLLFWLYTSKVLRMKMSDFGITHKVRVWAVLLSLLLPVLTAAVFCAAGKVSITESSLGNVFGSAAASLAFALKAGITEEMLFRGFIMTLVGHKWGKKLAIIAPSVFFGCVHLINFEKNFTFAGVVLLIVSGSLAGIMFSLAADRGSVGSNALMHTIWNFIMATNIMHITTEQEAYGAPLVSVIIPSESILLTGGDFGAEASIIAVVGYAAVCILIMLAGKKTASSRNY
ncbi:MAG: CPBP family intramembrane metalloprotease [Oscillospiraceae bacterium]|nr:CPBP family intramembrane metalloprotease [Oscillospiraceae bacterium]